jgi:8-oxo-dGTP pyrophosphatase MutT (NUDIX family)
MRDPNVSDPEVRAAGGIVHRQGDDGTEVLVVHRPKYQDWSLPKGKLDLGESPEQAALREVEEETGWRCRLGEHVGKNEYRDRDGRAKRVDWWLMEPVDGEFAPNNEVDEIRWVPLHQARELLTHDDDYRLIEKADLA